MIQGLSHITFIVKNLELSSQLLIYILGAKEIYSSGDKVHSIAREKFLLVDDIWIALMEGDSLSEKTYNHVAFKVDDKDFDGYVDRIRELKLVTREGRHRKAGEGRSIYFYDYDNHLFEIHTGELYARLNFYNKV